MQVFPDLGLVLIHSLDHFELIEGIIDVEQGSGCRFKGFQKPVVGLAKVVSEAFVASVDIPRLHPVVFQNSSKENKEAL